MEVAPVRVWVTLVGAVGAEPVGVTVKGEPRMGVVVVGKSREVGMRVRGWEGEE